MALCCSPSFFAASAPVNSGSLDFASWSSVTPASAIFASVAAGPLPSSVWLAGALVGMAAAASTLGGGAAAGGPASGLTGFSTAWDVSGALAEASAIGLAEDSLPWPTLPLTSAAMASDLPEVANLSASSRVLGVCLAIAAVTAAMKAALSNVPVGAAPISPALAALPCASLSSAGGLAALAASAALLLADGCFAMARRAAPIRLWLALNPGC